MSLPDNTIRFFNSIGCIAEPLEDGRYIIARHPRAAACAVKFLGCIFLESAEFSATFWRPLMCARSRRATVR